jgi:hypothetical protein
LQLAVAVITYRIAFQIIVAFFEIVHQMMSSPCSDVMDAGGEHAAAYSARRLPELLAELQPHQLFDPSFINDTMYALDKEFLATPHHEEVPRILLCVFLAFFFKLLIPDCIRSGQCSTGRL